MALANVVLVALAMFADLGVKPAIIQNQRGDDPAFLNTAWSIQIFRGFVLWFAAIAIAYPAAWLYGQPQLFPIVSLLGITAAINGFASTAMALSERRLSVRRLTVVQLLGQIAAAALTVFLAWWLQSVWSLVAGAISGALVTTLLSHFLIQSHRHRIIFERDAVRAILGFGQWIFLSTLVTFLGGQGLRAIQGVYLTPAELGVLTISQTLAWIPGEIGMLLMQIVGFPALSEIYKRGDAEFQSSLCEMRIKLSLFLVPLFIGLSLLSGPLISLIYDERYHAASTYLAISSIGGAISFLSMGYQSAFMAMGESRLHFFVLSFAMGFRIAGLIAGFYIDGINGMLIGIAIGSMINFILVFTQAARLSISSLKIDLSILLIISLSAAIVWRIYG